MTVSVDALTALANSLQVLRTGPLDPVPGAPFGAKLSPDVSQLRLTDTIPGQLDLAMISKDIKFASSDVEVLNLDQLNLLNDKILDVSPLTGVTGLLQQLKGTIPIPVEIPVRVEVTWALLKEDKTPLNQGSDFLAPHGLTSLDVSFIPRPTFVELTTQPPSLTTLFIRATVKLAVGAVATPPIPLPDLPILVPQVPVPTVLAFFVHSNFQPRDGDDPGAALVVVPPTSPLKSVTELQSTLDALDKILRSVRSLTGLAGFLLGVSDLISALPAQPHVQFRATDAIDNLNDITLIQNDIFTNDIEAEDELSSLILLGPEGLSLCCFIARDGEPDEGRFQITVGPELFVLVKSLHSANPVTEPADRLDNFGGDDEFGDQLSSFRFGTC